MASEDCLQVMEKRLQDIQKKLGKKHTFEEAVSSVRSVLQNYHSFPPSLRKSIYSVVFRVATVLQTRYTAPGFWLAGLRLFEEAERIATESAQKEHMKICIARAREHLHDLENGPEVPQSNARRGYLFEGHLTVDAEPPPPSWLVAQNLLSTFDVTQFNAIQQQNAAAESSQSHRQNDDSSDNSARVNAPEILQELINSMQEISGMPDLDSVIEASLQEIGAGTQRRPPASKEVVAKLPIITVTDDTLAKLGSETECAVCKEKMALNDKMQELPCQHLFHPDCLKPWLDEHNSCPMCRHELQTDDHAYESWKEREKEAEEERKGAANAIRGGEYMYV